MSYVELGFEGFLDKYWWKLVRVERFEVGENLGFWSWENMCKVKKEGGCSGFIFFQFFGGMSRHEWSMLRHDLKTRVLSRGVISRHKGFMPRHAALGNLYGAWHAAAWVKHAAAWLCFLHLSFCFTLARAKYAFYDPINTEKFKIMLCMIKHYITYYVNKIEKKNTKWRKKRQRWVASHKALCL